MTDDVPTPARAAEPPTDPAGAAAARADDPAEGRPDVPARDPAEDRAGREPGELVVALSPRQIIGGFALLAGLIIMLRRRGRRKG
jgi:hypothetical protein